MTPLLQVAIGMIGGILAGMIGMWKFIFSREGVWNLQISHSHTEIKYGENARLIAFTIHLKNIGKTKISPSDKGCSVVVREVPRDNRAGTLVRRGVGKILVEERDILKEWWDKRIGYGNYEIEPGCEYTELLTLVLEPGQIVEFKTTFFLQGYWPIPFYDFRQRRVRWREHDKITEYYVVSVRDEC